MRLVISLAAVALAFLTGAADAVTKAAQTPCFCQKDPSFEKDGANYCAPTAVSDGLIYLARARNLVGLVPGTDHAGQVQLIKALAEHMETDPDDGTPPGRVIQGLESYLEAKGYKLRQLEIATWRPVGDHAKIAAKPDLDWMRKVASAPDTVVMFGVGWYRRDGEGYSRHNGHWVDVVGVGEGDTQFLVHNPAIKAADQARKRTISLGKLDGFARLDSQRKPHDMSGYYAVKGPGLPFGAKTTAVLDAVMAFTVSM